MQEKDSEQKVLWYDTELKPDHGVSVGISEVKLYNLLGKQEEKIKMMQNEARKDQYKDELLSFLSFRKVW